MMRVFGAYRVGHAADGSPLLPPARLCQNANQSDTNHYNGRTPVADAEGTKP
jgi:hypothetical protein